MNARASFSSTRPASAHAEERLLPAFHPLWSSADDHALLKARAAGDNFTAIAARLDRSRIAVEQRWHRLRVLPNALKLLESYGLSIHPYPANGGRHG